MGGLKPRVQNGLKRLGVYERLKGSRAYDCFWWFMDRRVLEQRAGEVGFYRGLLRGFKAGDLIFDIGANQGHKVDIFLRLGATVVAVDPDPDNQRILRKTFQEHRIRSKPVTIVGKAVSDRVGRETMWVDAPGSAKNTLSSKWVETLRKDGQRFGSQLEFGSEVKVETTTLEELMATHGSPVFVKIDVEGYEPRVLQSLKRPVPYVSFEVNLPEFRAEGAECIRLLAALSASGSFNYSVDLQHGLALQEWMGENDFLRFFNACQEPSLEVFWRSRA